MRYLFLVVAVILLAACGGGNATPTTPPSAPAGTDTATPLPPTNTPVPPTATPEPPAEPTAIPGLITTLDDVQQAVVQIEAQAMSVNPAGEATSGSGRGSGFIIDPSGIAVTNNHVAGGAALLKVWVGGETRSRNARVLGVSECSDLAVIDIDGDGFPFLQWYEGRVRPGLDVYAAGFPLGDPEYTLTRGIVSKERAAGETSWASVDTVIEHDATINPGNSGGPLVTADGQVVGVNYRGRAESNQYYAIGRAAAIPVLEQLRGRNDVDSIGINPEAMTFDSGLTGIWASSVQSGSPADKAGIKGGDIIINMEGLDLAKDGTMADYCDILRTHSPEDTLKVSVVRFATQDVWDGQLNGRPLEMAFSFAEQGQQDVEEAASTTTSEPTYQNYVRITDDSGALVMEVPEEWDDIDGSPWTIDSGEVIGAKLTAQPTGAIDGPLVYLSAAVTNPDEFDADDILDQTNFEDTCGKYEGRSDYADQVYTGRVDQYSQCGDSNAVTFVVIAAPEDMSYFTLMMVVALTEADLEAADRVFNTFEVVDTLPEPETDPDNGGSGSFESGNATVNSETANVRSGPSTNYAVVATLSQDDRVQTMGRTADSQWVKLDLSDAPQAWMASRLLDFDDDVGSLAVVTSPAPPPVAAGKPCPPYLHKPKPGMGLLLVENHVNKPLQVDNANTTQRWEVTPKTGDTPGRLLLDLGLGSYQFIIHTPSSTDATIPLDAVAGSAFLLPVAYDIYINLYPLDFPASCR